MRGCDGEERAQEKWRFMRERVIVVVREEPMKGNKKIVMEKGEISEKRKEFLVEMTIVMVDR